MQGRGQKQDESGDEEMINFCVIQRPIYYMVLTALFAALTAVGAFLKIPFYPVPLTLQTFFTMLAAMVLPPHWAAASQLLYLAVGLIGLPVFANGGGLAYIVQPTFGYLLLLPLLAFFLAKVLKPYHSNQLAFIIIFSVQLVHLLGGSLWLLVNLSLTTGNSISLTKALMIGTVLFLPATVAKALALTWMKKKLSSMLLR